MYQVLKHDTMKHDRQSVKYYVKGYDFDGNYRMFHLHFIPQRKSEIKATFHDVLRNAWLYRVAESDDPFEQDDITEVRCY